MRILSLAFSKSSISTIFLFALAANKAASLTKFAKSAPENPGVPLASILGLTSFAIGVFLLGFNFGGWINGSYEGHAGALAALDAANGSIDLGAGSQQFIENMKSGGNTIGAIAAWLFYGAGFLIAVLPLWISPKD